MIPSIQPTLQRWAELEPERCILIDPLQWEYSIIASSERGLVGEIRVNGIAPSCKELMLLESVIRDVMITRRIRPSVGMLDIDLPIWVSRANKFIGTDATAAIALLKAYLECLSSPVDPNANSKPVERIGEDYYYYPGDDLEAIA